MPAHELERTADGPAQALGVTALLPPGVEGGTAQVHEQVGEDGVVVARLEGRTREAQPGETVRGVEGGGEVDREGTHADEAPRHAEGDHEEGEEDQAGHRAPRSEAKPLEQGVDEGARRHAEDDPEADRDVCRGDARRDVDEKGEGAVDEATSQVAAREDAHAAGDEEEGPGDARPPHVQEGRGKPRHRQPVEVPQVVAEVEGHHREDREAPHRVEDAHAPHPSP